MRRVHNVVVALTVACAATGCSVYDDLTTSDFAKQDGDAIVAAASEAMLDVQSMRITGQARTKGNQFFIDLRMDRDDNCIGTIRFGGSNIDIRRGRRPGLDQGRVRRLQPVEQRARARPRPRQAEHVVAARGGRRPREHVLRPRGAPRVLRGRRARRQESGKGDEKRKGKDKGKDRTDDLSGEVPTTVGDETSEDGQKIVQLSGSPGGQHEELAWVRSEAPHHVVRIESTSMQDGGSIAFSEFDEEFEVEVPKDKDVIRP